MKRIKFLLATFVIVGFVSFKSIELCDKNRHVQHLTQSTTDLNVIGQWRLDILDSKIQDDDFMMIDVEFKNDDLSENAHNAISWLQKRIGNEGLFRIGWLPRGSKRIQSEGTCKVYFRQTTRDSSYKFDASYIHYSTGSSHGIIMTWAESGDFTDENTWLFSFDPYTSDSETIHLTEQFHSSGNYKFDRISNKTKKWKEQFFPDTDWILYDLRGKVESLEIKDFETRRLNGHTWVKSDLQHMSRYHFNEDGYCNIQQAFSFYGRPIEYEFLLSGDYNLSFAITMENGAITSEATRVSESGQLVFYENRNDIKTVVLKIEIEEYGVNKLIQFDDQGKPIVITQFHRNKDNYQIRQKQFVGDQESDTYFFYSHFDSLGNWTRRYSTTELYGTIPSRIEERFIEYYD